MCDIEKFGTYPLATAVGGRTVHVRHGNPALPAYVFIHGSCQVGGFTWRELVRIAYAEGLRNTMIVVERYGHDQRVAANRPYRIGRMTLTQQVEDMKAIADALFSSVHLYPQQRINWVGHSVGGLLARHMARLFPLRTKDVVEIATWPSVSLAVACNLVFWTVGLGLLAVPAAMWSWITGRGVRYPNIVVKRVFVGSHASQSRLQDYLEHGLSRDSGRLFPILGFWYRPSCNELRLARNAGWLGQAHLVLCSHDRLMPRRAMIKMGQGYNSTVEIDEAHCWFVHPRNMAGTYQRLMRLLMGANGVSASAPTRTIATGGSRKS